MCCDSWQMSAFEAHDEVDSEEIVVPVSNNDESNRAETQIWHIEDEDGAKGHRKARRQLLVCVWPCLAFGSRITANTELETVTVRLDATEIKRRSPLLGAPSMHRCLIEAHRCC